MHALPCGGASASDRSPVAWRGRPQVLRAYDGRGWIHPASRLHDGTEPDVALREVFGEPGVVALHSRNVAYGWFMFAAVRTHP